MINNEKNKNVENMLFFLIPTSFIRACAYSRKYTYVRVVHSGLSSGVFTDQYNPFIFLMSSLCETI